MFVSHLSIPRYDDGDAPVAQPSSYLFVAADSKVISDDDHSQYSVGTYDSFAILCNSEGVTVWPTPGTFKHFDRNASFDDFQSYSTGTGFSSLSGGSNWGGNGTFFNVENNIAIDDFQSYSVASGLTSLSGGSNWGGSGTFFNVA
jgi:hypothetical protein